MRPRCLLRRRSSYMTSRQLCCVFHYFLASVKHQTCLGSSSPLGKKRKMPGIFFIFYFFSSPLKVSMTLLIHLALSRARCAVGVMSLTLPTYKTSPVCICDSKNTLSVFVFKHADERWPLELVFKMFCQGTELLFRRKLFKCFVEISPHTSSTNKWSLFMTSSSFLCFPCLSMSSCFSLPLISVRPSRPRSLHLLRYAVPTTRPTRSCRSSSSGCGTRWLTWRAVCCPRPCCSTGAGWAQRTFWYPSFKSRSSLFVSLLVWPSTGGTNPVSNLLLVWILCVEQ